MAYGLTVFKTDGNVGFSTTDITWQTLDQFTVPANISVTKTYPEAAGLSIIAQRQLVNVPPTSQEDYVPNISVGTTTVTVSPQSGHGSSECIIHVLAQDV